jgi:hypothetical protein
VWACAHVTLVAAIGEDSLMMIAEIYYTHITFNGAQEIASLLFLLDFENPELPVPTKKWQF